MISSFPSGPGVREPEAAISRYFAGVSKYPLVEASVRLVVDQDGLGSGSQPLFLDMGAGEGEGEGRGRLIFGRLALLILLEVWGI